MEELWNGYRCKKLIFEGHEGFVVFPKEEKANGYLALKTEYWGAFPEALELPLLERGFHLCFIRNDNRWGTDDNLDRQARFVRSCMAEYALKPQCIPIGMSCRRSDRHQAGGQISGACKMSVPGCPCGQLHELPLRLWHRKSFK